MTNDFWIGDLVCVVGHQGVGRYAGEVGTSMAKVDLGGKVLLVNSSDISLAPDDYTEDKVKLELLVKDLNADSSKKNRTPVPDTIDLHMEELDPDGRIHQNRVLDYQLEQAKNYLQSAIAGRKRVVTIIHGKGSGLLKASVLHHLQTIDAVTHLIDKHNGGATEVWLV